MRILLVDNGTTHLTELKKLAQNHNVEIIKNSDLADAVEADLIILSGGSQNPVNGNQSLYEQELNLIRNSNVPIIGICMGFELIAYAHGAELKELPHKEEGLLEIVVTSDDDIFGNEKYFKVEERHRWAVVKINEPLVQLAISKDGIEAIKHKSKLIYGFQFHPEIFEDENAGTVIFNNLIKSIEQGYH